MAVARTTSFPTTSFGRTREEFTNGDFVATTAGTTRGAPMILPVGTSFGLVGGGGPTKSGAGTGATAGGSVRHTSGCCRGVSRGSDGGTGAGSGGGVFHGSSC